MVGCDTVRGMGEETREARYTTDDIDIDPHALELVISVGGNGDYYVAVVPQGQTPMHGVRIVTSGTRVHGLAPAISSAYRAILDAGARAVLAKPPLNGDAKKCPCPCHDLGVPPHDCAGCCYAPWAKWGAGRASAAPLALPTGKVVTEESIAQVCARIAADHRTGFFDLGAHGYRPEQLARLLYEALEGE